MTSEIIPLRDAAGHVVYTGWLRRYADSGRVIYAGFYTNAVPPRHDGACVKVVFPVPSGNATVLLRPEVQADGSLRLISSGKRFGGPGFYRVLAIDHDRWRVFFIRTLREEFKVYLDAAGVLRCDHTVRLLGLTVLRLHYQMTRTA